MRRLKYHALCGSHSEGHDTEHGAMHHEELLDPIKLSFLPTMEDSLFIKETEDAKEERIA